MFVYNTIMGLLFELASHYEGSINLLKSIEHSSLFDYAFDTSLTGGQVTNDLQSYLKSAKKYSLKFVN